MNNGHQFRAGVLFPLLLSIYPVVNLMANNIWGIQPVDALRSILVALLGAMFALFCFRLLLRSWNRAALVTGVFIVLFFSYGHVYNFLLNHPVGGMDIGRNRYLLPVWIVLFIAGYWSISRITANLRLVVNMFGIISIGLMILPIGMLVRYLWLNYQFGSVNTDWRQQVFSLGNPVNKERPDIYYIILDMYGRDDAIQQYLHYDNTPFLEQLESLGFYVARCSRSNYNGTQYSLASSLNMAYLPNLDQEWAHLFYSVRDSTVHRSLSELGYTSYAFQTGFPFIEMTDVNQFLSPASMSSSDSWLLGSPNFFEDLLLNYSAGFVFTDFRNLVDPAYQNYRWHITRQLFLLDQLAKLPSQQSPKFVYAHVLIPHTPFVFGPQGALEKDVDFNINHITIDPESYRKGYIGQIEYINGRILSIVKMILNESRPAPIIILQGDHGFEVNGRKINEILNAYYLPNGGVEKLYPRISPVNSFRVVFDTYFGTQYGLLDDSLNQVQPEIRQNCKP